MRPASLASDVCDVCKENVTAQNHWQVWSGDVSDVCDVCSGAKYIFSIRQTFAF
jgi:hypothetical protein